MYDIGMRRINNKSVEMNSWFVSLLFFIYTLGLAFWQHWSATDIVWSMWFASLVSGYVVILCNIIGSSPQSEDDVARRNDGFAKSLLLLVFFSIHFIGFHFGHSQAMWGFFPLTEQQPGFLGLLALCAERYWAFIIVALVNVWPLLRRNWQTQSELRFEEPYKAVIRNHIMIFIVAFASAAVSQQQLLYLLLVFYFFPFSKLRSLISRREVNADRAREKL